MYIGEAKIDFWFRINKYFGMVLKYTAVVYCLNALGYWFKDNHSFVNAIFIAVFCCMISGPMESFLQNG